MRTYLTLAALLCLAATIGAQDQFVKAWSKTFGTGSIFTQTGVDVAVDAANNIFVLGTEATSGEGVNFLIAKFNPAGEQQWLITRNSGAALNDTPVAIAVTSGGDVYASGTSSGGNLFTVKYNTLGQFQWEALTDAGGTETADDMTIDLSGNCYISGSTKKSKVTPDGLVVRINANGTFGWSTIEVERFGDAENGKGIVFRAGSIYTCGTMKISASDTDIYAAKYSTEGGTFWLRRLHLPYVDLATAEDIDISEDGSKLVVVGKWRRFLNGASDPNSVSAGAAWFRESDGAVLHPVGPLESNFGTMPFDVQNTLSRAVKIGRRAGVSGPFAYGTYEGTTSTEDIWEVGGALFPDAETAAQTHSPVRTWTVGAASLPKAMGDAAIEPASKMGFVVGSRFNANSSSFDIFVRRMGINPTTDGEFFFGPKAEGAAIVLDGVDDVIVLGTQTSDGGAGHVNPFLMKLVQRPGLLPDAYHMFKNQELIVNAAKGVKANDCGSTLANVILKDSNPIQKGTVTLATDGSFVFTPPVNFSGTDGFNYRLNKSPFGDVEFGDDTHPVDIFVYPFPSALNLPVNLFSGIRIGLPIQLDGNEPVVTDGQPLLGSASCSPSGVVLFRTGWLGNGGTQSGEVVADVQGVASDTPVTITVSRGGESASDTTIVKPGPGILSVTFTPSSVVGGDSTTGKVTLAAPAPAGGKAIFLSSNSGFLTVPSQIQIPQGASSQTFAVQTAAVEGGPFSRTVTAQDAPFNQSQSVITQKSGNLVITEPPALTALALGSSAIHGGQSTTGTVTLAGAAPSTGLAVSLSTNSSSILIPASVSVAGGLSSASFVVSTTQVGATAVRTITASKGAIGKTASLQLIPSPELSNFTLSHASCTGGESLTGLVTLTGAPSVPTGVRVAISDNSTAISTPTSTLVAQGSATKSFSIGTLSIQGSATRSVTATLLGKAFTRSLLIHPTPQLTQLEITPSTVKGGSSTVGKVTLSGIAGISDGTVTLTDDSSAIGVPASVSVLHGTTSRTFTITTTAVPTTVTRHVTAKRLSVTITRNLVMTP